MQTMNRWFLNGCYAFSMKYLGFLLFILLSFNGCSFTPIPKNQLDKVVILNHTDTEIKNVSIYAYSTNKILKCSFLPSNAHCSYSFSRNKSTKNMFKIQWQSQNQEYKHEYVSIQNMNFNNDLPIHITMNILPNGKFFINEF